MNRKTTYFFGQDMYSLVVFYSTKVDAVDRKNGISHEEVSTSLSRLSRVHFRD